MKKNLFVLFSLLIAASMMISACSTQEIAATPIPVHQSKVVVEFVPLNYDENGGEDQVVEIRIATSSGNYGEEMKLTIEGCEDIPIMSHHPGRLSVKLSCLLNPEITLQSASGTMSLTRTHGVIEVEKVFSLYFD